MDKKLENIKTGLENELYGSVIPFWEKYSVDRTNGGYFNCLTRDGRVYDNTRYMWLHSRQVWMFSKLYNTVSQEKKWLRIAGHGMDFIRKHAVSENGRVYFSLNAKGKPVYLQRKIFTECFYAMALAEYGRATGSGDMLKEAENMFDRVWEMSRDPSLAGRPHFEGETGFQTLAVPMILLNVIEEVYGTDHSRVSGKVDECIQKMAKHFINGKVFENVLPGGEPVDSSAGRLLNPGHAIEAGWFMYHWAIRLQDDELKNRAAAFIRNSFETGWDKQYGGIFYFLDAGGYSPIQLEWDMKLWWPHCEALYAFLLLYAETGRSDDLEKFLRVHEYAFSRFSDPEYGEWFGYLNRQGQVSMDFKGGPYKGCFHVPRALYLCLQLLRNISNAGH